MRIVISLVTRHLLMFKKDRTNVFLCFFSIIIVFSLYGIFLRSFMIQTVHMTDMNPMKVEEFTDRLMLSGLLIVINVVTSFAIMQLYVQDKETSKIRDFILSVPRSDLIVFGYWSSSTTISFIYTMCAYIGTLIYYYVRFKIMYSVETIVQVSLILFVSSILNAQLLLCIVAFMKNTTTFSTFGNLYGMLVGFLANAYLPYELYDDRLRHIIFFFPATHLVCMIRKCMLKGCFSDYITDVSIQSKLYDAFGVQLMMYNHKIPYEQQCAYLVLSFAIMLFVLAMIDKITNR